MKRLFTYTIPVDDGAAPNPFYGMCSLAICKPGIRRVAKVGDWVAGLGSINAPSGDLSGRLVYAMRVDEVLTLKEYDQKAHSDWPHRIPRIDSADLSERLGDCIYDYSVSLESPIQRPSVHGPENRVTDLRGENVLISRRFYYFGSSAKLLPPDLNQICHQQQGHRSNANHHHVEMFETWLRSLNLMAGQHGWPDYVVEWAKNHKCDGCITRKHAAEYDEGC
ncbi:MAG TPA: hypothetical protein VFE46_16520 [Pirellulales bacterium]|jgi:hypothetical protein|nr:hypothetical protein [Pirellulales bacterium]